MPFAAGAPLDDASWELVSEYSLAPTDLRTHNTGFSDGTSMLRPSGRMLAIDVDEHLIRHTVVRGTKTPLPGGEWRFEKEGVVVVTRGQYPAELEILDAFVVGFVTAETQQNAKKKYEAMLQALEESLDGDDRLRALASSLCDERVLSGVDLTQTPPDCPLLQHCAKEGWAECVQELLQRGFQAGLGHRCKHRMTLLHLAAWGGHTGVIEALGPQARLLADIANEYGELPELSGFIRSRQLESGGALANACLAAAVACRGLRTGEVSDPSGRDFVEEANGLLSSAVAENQVLLPIGVEENIVQQSLARPVSCTDMVSRYVSLSSVLHVVLSSTVHNRNLERLVLEYCGLTRDCCPLLADFLMQRPRHLVYLELTGNAFGDSGIRALLCPGLAAVQSLGLGETGMTSASLGDVSRCLKGGSMEKLSLAANDLSESTSCEAIDALGGAVEASTALRVLDLSKTRLQSPQLRRLAQAVRVAPALEQLLLVQVGMKDELASEHMHVNPLLSALSDLRCSVLRVEVSILEYPGLWKALMAAKRGRTKGKGTSKGRDPSAQAGGKASKAGKAGKAGKGGVGVGNTWPRKGGHEGTASTQEILLRFPAEHPARLKALRRPRPSGPLVATLCAETFGLQADCPPGIFTASDVGKAFNVRLDIKYQLQLHDHTLGDAPAFRSSFLECKAAEALGAPGPRSLDAVCLVLYRPATNAVMLVHAPTAAFRLFRSRVLDHMLADHFVLKERFGVSRKLGPSISAEEALEDLALTDFSTDEVRIIARLKDPECYRSFVGAAAMTARHRVEHERALASGGLRRLIADFGREAARREGPGPEPSLSLPEEEVLAARIGGSDSERRVDLPGAVSLCLLKLFADAVELRGGVRMDQAAECVDEARGWRRLLFPAMVPEAMVEGGEVLGTRPARPKPEWVPVTQLAEVLRCAPSPGGSNFPAIEGVAAVIGKLQAATPSERVAIALRSDSDTRPLSLFARR